MFKEPLQFSQKPEPDLTNSDYIREVFESGSPEELKKIADFHHLNSEQISLFCHFAKLRKAELDSMREELISRLAKNPIATDDELSMGAYQENIEPQVREVVNNLRHKGYSTYESGFGDFDGQTISFESDYLDNYKLPVDLLNRYEDAGVKIVIEPDSIKLHFTKEFSLEEITNFWKELETYIPKLDESVKPCKLDQAKCFREKQTKLKLN